MSELVKEEPTYQRSTAEQTESRLTFPNPVNYTPGNFRKTFRTPFEQYAHRIGHEFKVVRELSTEEKNLDVDEPMYLIRFGDGSEIVAWGEEVCD